MTRKIAIVAAAPASQMLAPFDDPDWEIWVLGNQLAAYKRVSRTFEIHDDLSNQHENYVEWLIDNAPSLVVGEAFPITSNGIEVYPFDEVNALLGGEHLSSSVAYMMGYALLHGATHIGLYGVDMSVGDHEYFKQRPDMYAWIGYAKAKGVDVCIPDEASIFKSTYCEGRDYGAGSDTGLRPFTQKEFSDMAAQHNARIKEIKSQVKRLKREADTHYGCVQTYEHMGRAARAIGSGATVNSLSDITLRIGSVITSK